MPDTVGRFRAPQFATAPANPAPGEVYFNTVSNILFFWNGTAWTSTQSSAGTIYDSDPVGTVKAYAGTTIPTNWMIADGRPLSRTAYASLFAVVSTKYGAGDGSTTFNIPDLRSRMLVGADYAGSPALGSGLTSRALAAASGEESHTLANGEMPSHSHGGQTGSGTTGGGITGTGTTGNDNQDHVHSLTSPQGDTFALGWGGGTYWNTFASPGGVGVGQFNTTTAGRSAAHQHSVPSLSIPGLSVPNLSIGVDGGSGAHNNMPPWCAVALILKVVGGTISP